MGTPATNALLPVIQLALTPVILISGMGALMFTLTGRMGRVVDRTRILAERMHVADGDEQRHLEGQLDILWKRAQHVRRAVTFNGLSMLVSCLLVVAIFVGAMLGRDLGWVILVLFATSIVLLIAALVAFLLDIFVSLRALRLEVDRAHGRNRVAGI